MVDIEERRTLAWKSAAHSDPWHGLEVMDKIISELQTKIEKLEDELEELRNNDQ
jgi:hypothetical protein